MLHGDIRVNNVVIGEWTAENITGRDRFRNYHCTLWYRANDGYIYEADWELWGEAHTNGAMTLAERVLREGRTRAKRSIRT